MSLQGVTKSSRVWRKEPERDARSVTHTHETYNSEMESKKETENYLNQLYHLQPIYDY